MSWMSISVYLVVQACSRLSITASDRTENIRQAFSRHVPLLVLTVFVESDCTLVGAQSTFSQHSRCDEHDHSLSTSTLICAQDAVFLSIFLHSCTSTHTLLYTPSYQLKAIHHRKRTRNRSKQPSKSKLSNTRSTTHI
jgi:hypothetical protein